MDKATTNCERIEYARVFVEISATKPLVKFVDLQFEEGDSVQVEVEYERVPPLCHKCSSFGHVQSQCPTKEVWLPKEATVGKAEKVKNMKLFMRMLMPSVEKKECI